MAALTNGLLGAVSAKQRDDDASGSGKARVQDSGNNFISSGTTSAYGVSDLLTVWRMMHVEVDSMGPVSGNSVSGNVVSVNTASTRKVVTDVTKASLNNDSGERFQNGKLTIGSDVYDVVRSDYSSGGKLRVYIKRNLDANGIEVSVPAPTDGFTLVDDDRLVDGQDVPAPDTSHVATAFKPAYMKPVFDGGDPNMSYDNGNVPFVLNDDKTPVGDNSLILSGKGSVASIPEYWVAYVLGAFQQLTTTDIDSDFIPGSNSVPGAVTVDSASELAALGLTISKQNSVERYEGSVIYLEAIEDFNRTAVSTSKMAVQNQAWIVAHEIGHLFIGNIHESEDKLMDIGGNILNPVFENKSLATIRNAAHP